MPVRVLDSSGTGTDAEIVAGMAYAAEEGADVINMSLGGPGAGAVFEDAVSAYPNTTFVVAAGNSGTNNDLSPSYPCNVTTANLICVAASEPKRRAGELLQLRVESRRP